MAAPYSQDLRDKVLAAYDRGMRTREIATTFDISPAWARRIKQRRREDGETVPRAMGGARVIKIDMAGLVERAHWTGPCATLTAPRLAGCGDGAVSCRSHAVQRRRRYRLHCDS